MNPTTSVKICGIRDNETAEATAKAGAHYIGLIFFEKSKRFVTLPQAKILSDTIRKNGAIPVAVFVDTDHQTIQTICEETQITTVQLHGEIVRLQHHHLPQNFTRIYVVEVDQSGSPYITEETAFKLLDKNRDFLLFDGMQAGSGNLALPKKESINFDMRFFIAGGLNSENVGKIIQSHQPFGVDVSSGVESEAGVKDINKIIEFINVSCHASEGWHPVSSRA